MNVKYLIIGNSSGGIGAVEAIRKHDNENSIAIVSDENMHTYSRALIPYYLRGKIEKHQLYYRSEEFYEKNHIITFLGKKVTDIDTESQNIFLKDGDKIHYEYLVIASGGEPFVPPIKGLKNNYYTFTTFKDAEQIKKGIELGRIKKTVILGAGLIGLLAAESLKTLGMEVTVIELANRILIKVLDSQTSEIFQDIIRAQDIELIMGHTIAEIVNSPEDPKKIEKIILDNQKELDCDLLIIAIGVRPRIDFLKNTGIETNRGIIIDRYMRTNISNIYACGDCAEIYDFIFDENKLTPIWPAAYIGGMTAGNNITGENTEINNLTSMNSMKFFGLPVMSAGLIESPDKGIFEELIKYDSKNKIYKKLIVSDGIIKGFIVLNQIENTGIVLNLMRNEINISEFKDEILENDFDLIDLPRQVRKRIMIGGLE